MGTLPPKKVPKRKTCQYFCAILFQSSHLKQLENYSKNSFEYSEWKICPFGSMMFKLIIIYRPPYSSTHPVSMGTFFNELIEYLESVILCPHPVLITGDFNVHVDNPSNDDALKFLNLLESLGLEQHVQEATHIHGHTQPRIQALYLRPALRERPWRRLVT